MRLHILMLLLFIGLSGCEESAETGPTESNEARESQPIASVPEEQKKAEKVEAPVPPKSVEKPVTSEAEKNVVEEERETVAIGSPLKTVLAIYGEPDSKMNFRGETHLKYSGSTIRIKDGKVSYIDPRIEHAIRMEAKGLVEYKGKWVTEAEYKKALAAATPSVREIRNGGKRIYLNQLLVPGQITIVDFFADWCGPCKRADPYLKKLAKNPGVSLIKVDIVRWGTDVTKQFNINSIPKMIVYDRNGKVTMRGTSSVSAIIDKVKELAEGPG